MYPEQARLFREPTIKVLLWIGLVDNRGNSSIPAYPLIQAWAGEPLLPGPASCPGGLITKHCGDSSLLLLRQKSAASVQTTEWMTHRYPSQISGKTVFLERRFPGIRCSYTMRSTTTLTSQTTHILTKVSEDFQKVSEAIIRRQGPIGVHWPEATGSVVRGVGSCWHILWARSEPWDERACVHPLLVKTIQLHYLRFSPSSGQFQGRRSMAGAVCCGDSGQDFPGVGKENLESSLGHF